MKEIKNNEMIEELGFEIEEPQKQQTKKSTNKHGFRGVCAIGLALVLMVGSSFAYFTDYAATSTSGTAGTLSVALDSDINLLDENGMDILNPGDVRSGSFTVTNMGNKSADIRTTIALTAYDRNGDPIDLEGSETTQSMYDLYLADDVEYVEGQGNKPKAGAQPLQTKSISGNVITYSIPEYSLDGNSDLYDEVETIQTSTGYMVQPFRYGAMDPKFDIQEKTEYENIVVENDYTKNCDFVLVFNTQAGNEWQASIIQIDIIVEAKQHENTSAGWHLVEHQDLVVGSLSQAVVLPENVITTNGTINPGYQFTPSIGGSTGTSTTTCSIKGEIENLYDDDLSPITVTLYNTAGEEVGTYAVDDSNPTFEFNNLTPNTEYSVYIGTMNYFGNTTYVLTTDAAGSIKVLTVTIT